PSGLDPQMQSDLFRGIEIAAFPSGLNPHFLLSCFYFAAICLLIRRQKYRSGRFWPARTLGK
ncbi:MAG TPA: hypothetical protein VE176_07590, partial [Candidatus Limnocylindrales bacterium]|nr:hypothetical protein [Candidatus Limnocylindrales bacterium]